MTTQSLLTPAEPTQTEGNSGKGASVQSAHVFTGPRATMVNMVWLYVLFPYSHVSGAKVRL